MMVFLWSSNLADESGQNIDIVDESAEREMLLTMLRRSKYSKYTQFFTPYKF